MNHLVGFGRLRLNLLAVLGNQAAVLADFAAISG